MLLLKSFNLKGTTSARRTNIIGGLLQYQELVATHVSSTGTLQLHLTNATASTKTYIMVGTRTIFYRYVANKFFLSYLEPGTCTETSRKKCPRN